MIIDFTIKNFRSIKSEQTFSMYAENPGTHLTENIAYPAGDKIGVLRSAGIYGANASGKSNLLLAFEALRNVMCFTNDLKEGDDIPYYEPYLLSQETQNSPVNFEIEFFTLDKTRYKYNVSFTKERIIEENLEFYSTAKAASIFSRNAKDTWETINFGSLYKGGKKRHPLFENNSYVAVAGSKADSPELIRNVYNFFRKEVFQLSSHEKIDISEFKDNTTLLEKASKLLSYVDTGINGIKVEEDDKYADLKIPEGVPEAFHKSFIRRLNTKYLFAHKTENGDLKYFDIKDESSGTQKLFELAPVIIDALGSGGVLILDELDNSMHPFMAELVIKLFNDPEVNCNGAQLIFSTHNIGLMSPKFFRRDQIWFSEKNNGETTFHSLEDYDKKKVKSQSPFYRWYTEGRFGGIPKIDYRSISDLINNK